VTGPLRLDRYADPADFLAAAGPWLTEREAEHNLILGIAATARDNPGMYVGPYFATVTDGVQLVAAAMRTPPYNVILSEIDDGTALDLLVADLAATGAPGVVARPDVATVFATRWVAAHGGSWQIGMEERIFELSAVIPPRPAPGAMRAAMPADRRLLIAWITAFAEEALGDDDASRVASQVDDWLTGRGRTLWLWDDDGPKSLTGVGGATPHGIRIGPVYTPPEVRGRGYASALVAAVSQAQLDAGRRFCFLYTDLSNPTSNKIYQAIGYRPVTDALRIDFHP
jgi:predicted GNAT family acetyltransferase